MLESQEYQWTLLSFFLLGEGGNKAHLLCTREKVSLGGLGILVSLGRQKAKETFNFVHLMLLG